MSEMRMGSLVEFLVWNSWEGWSATAGLRTRNLSRPQKCESVVLIFTTIAIILLCLVSNWIESEYRIRKRTTRQLKGFRGINAELSVCNGLDVVIPYLMYGLGFSRSLLAPGGLHSLGRT